MRIKGQILNKCSVGKAGALAKKRKFGITEASNSEEWMQTVIRSKSNSSNVRHIFPDNPPQKIIHPENA